MPTCGQSASRRIIPLAVFPLSFFVLFYLHVWLWIDPRLVYHRQCPIFMLGSAFFRDFLNRPGGLVEYLCALLSQVYPYPAVGALVITTAAGLVCLTTRTFVTKMGGTGVHVVYLLLPAILLLMLHNEYDHPLTTSVGLLTALVSVNVHVHLFADRAAHRFVTFLILSAFLYHAAAGPYLLFAVLCALFELLSKERLSLGLLCLLSALVLPFAAGTYIFNLGILDAYARLLPFHPDVDPSMMSIALYVFFPLMAVTVSLWSRPDPDASPAPDRTGPPPATSPLGHDRPAQLKGVGQSLGLFLIAIGVVFLSFDRQAKTLLQVDYYARHKMWPQVLQKARRLPAEQYTITTYWDVNRALFHTGRLARDMFSYPQDPSGLLSNNSEPAIMRLPQLARLNLGGIFLELGRVAEAEHITQEALENLGDWPPIIRRLVEIYVVKREGDTARIFLNALSKHLLWRDRARDYRRRLEEDPLLDHDQHIEHLRSIMIVIDHLGHVSIETMMQQLLERNKHNRMAFEYLMAYYLLNRELEEIARNIGRLDDFDYPDIPRHYEEALLLHMRAAGNRDIDLHGRQINPDTRRRFEAFFEIYDRHRGDKQGARDALFADFADSYLFYNTFGVGGYGRELLQSPSFTGAQ